MAQNYGLGSERTESFSGISFKMSEAGSESCLFVLSSDDEDRKHTYQSVWTLKVLYNT